MTNSRRQVVIGIPLGILKGYSIFGMLGYVPLALMINTLYDVTNMSKTWGNVLVWLSLYSRLGLDSDRFPQHL